MENRSLVDAEPLRCRPRSSKVRRWDPTTRTTSPWDGLRRDPELWFQSGDCLVHLYAKGHSKRGPAFRVPFQAIYDNKFSAILSLCFAQRSDSPHNANVCELYVPAPDECAKDAAFRWHLTTRNFFAFLFGKPLVGTQFGRTLIDLQERIQLFRPGDSDNRKELLRYLEQSRYLDLAHCPDYSLGLLQYAENYHFKELWIDSFAHCVGMNKILSESAEFPPTSRVTQQLITNASLKQEINLTAVTRSLSNFLEDELSPANLGLSQGARAHLDHFRSFLHSHYIEKFHYWPPPTRSPFPKTMYQSMYFDFRNLYDLLVDLESTASLQDQRPASGGICVLQNVQAFDKRHNYIPLPHPLPLLPEHAEDRGKTQSQRVLRRLTISSKHAKSQQTLTVRNALAKATNSSDPSMMNAKLVQEYQRFEREWNCSHEEKVSVRDARKVRWLLVYGCLQMLVSAIRAPKEVRDVDGPAYPLSCLVPSSFPWEDDAKVLNGQHGPSMNVPATEANASRTTSDAESLPSTPPLTIHPDCETDDYFSHARTTKSSPIRTRPVSALGKEPPISRSGTNVFRSASVRSMKRLSLGPRRKTTTVLKPPTSNFCEILIHGYGNGLNKTIIDPPAAETSSSTEETVGPIELPVSPQVSSEERDDKVPGRPPIPPRRKAKPPVLAVTTNTIPEEQRTPVVDSFDMENISNPPSRKDSTASESTESDSTPRSPLWSGAVTPTSVYSDEEDELPALVHSSITRNSSLNTTSSASVTLSPVSVVESESPRRELEGIIIKRSFSVDSFLIEDMKGMGMQDLQDASAWPAALKLNKKDGDESVLGVYQSSGLSLRKPFNRRRSSLTSGSAHTSKSRGERRGSVRLPSWSDGDLVETLAKTMLPKV